MPVLAASHPVYLLIHHRNAFQTLPTPRCANLAAHTCFHIHRQWLAEHTGASSLRLMFMAGVAIVLATLGVKLLGKEDCSGSGRRVTPFAGASQVGCEKKGRWQARAVEGWDVGGRGCAGCSRGLAVPPKNSSTRTLAPSLSSLSALVLRHPCPQLGGALMALFFSIIGTSAGSFAALACPEAPAMLAFIAVMCSIHWAFMLAANTVLRLPVPAMVLGSNACIGGPATAGAMAANRGWSSLVQPAMVTGSLGYAVGTAAGLMVARLAGCPVCA